MSRIAAVALCLLPACTSLDFDRPVEEFGPEPTVEQLQSVTDNHLQQVMFDPESKRIRWVDLEPRHAALWRGLIGGGWNHGWGMRFFLNGKNRMGGYVGEKSYYVIQTPDEIIYVGEALGDFFEVDSRPAAPSR